MTLEQLEAAFFHHNAEVTKNRDGSRTVTFDTKQGVSYPITFSEEQNGWLRAYYKFPGRVMLPVQEGTELARRLSDRVPKPTRINFTSAEYFFYADCFITAGQEWEEEVCWFLTACDLLVPLFVKVAHTRSWDDCLIDLACAPRNDETTIH